MMSTIPRAFIVYTAALVLMHASSAASQSPPMLEIKAGKATQRTSGAATSASLEPVARARFDKYGNLLPAGGAFKIDAVGSLLQGSWTQATTVTWTITLIPSRQQGDRAEQILAVPRIGDFSEFALIQAGAALCFAYGKQAAKLGELTEQPVHVTVEQTHSGATVYVNGEFPARAVPPGDVTVTTPGPDLVIGSGTFTTAGWSGRIHHLAAFPQELPEDAVKVASVSAVEQAATQKFEPALVVLAKRIGRSDTIPLDELAPYTQSLTVYAYSVVKVIGGDAPEEPLYVAHWAILDSTRLPFDEKPGEEPVELQLDLFSDHPELQTEHISDGVIDDFALPLYYDTGGASLGLGDSDK